MIRMRKATISSGKDNSIKSIIEEKNAEIVVKKSKFIASIFKVENKEQAEQALESVRKKLKDEQLIDSHDTVEVLIKEIAGSKIALSLKFEDANPWKNAAEKYAVGNVVTGKVARMTDFGAFVELESGVDALLHVSQISKEHVEKPADVLKIGQEVTAKIVDFNEEGRKISLSIKALLAPEPKEEAKDEDADADVVSVDIDAVIAQEESESAE